MVVYAASHRFGEAVGRSRAAGYVSHVTARLVVMAAAVAAVLAVTGAVASACTAMATLEFDQAAPGPGDEVSGSGKGFQASHGQTQTQDVVLRFDARDGPELAQVTAGADGTIDFSFEVPDDAAPGHHVIVATQRDAEGTPVYGTPARQSLEVAGSASSASASAPVVPAAADGGRTSAGSDRGGHSAPPGLAFDAAGDTPAARPLPVDAGTVALWALALVLGVGAVASARQRRERLSTAGT